MVETSDGVNVQFGRTSIGVVSADVLLRDVEALILPANRRGILGAGLTGAVRVAAGPDIERQLMSHAPLALGSAVLTDAGRLAERGLRGLIHASISDQLGAPTTAVILRRAIEDALRLAEQQRFRSLALPPLGSGDAPGHLPLVVAADILVGEIVAFLRRSPARIHRIELVTAVSTDVPTLNLAVARARERAWTRAS